MIHSGSWTRTAAIAIFSLGVCGLALLKQLVRSVARTRLRSLFGGSARRIPTPSVSLYFADPLAGLIDSDEDFTGRPIQQLSQSVYVCGRAAVVIRYANREEIKILRRGRFERIYLVIDDDLESLKDPNGLPPDYRRRLLRYRNGAYRELCEIATDVVAPSENILRAHHGKRTLHLDPVQCHPVVELDHHREHDRLEIVFAGSRSHLHDFERIAPALADVLSQLPHARLTTFLNGHAPKELRKQANAIHISPMGWQQYRRFVAENNFHVAIAPALDTSFNRARSISKLHDHAAFGAAGLYSRQQPFDRIVSHGQTGLLISNDPDDWRQALLDLASRRDRTLRIATGGQVLSRTLGDMQRVRKFWMHELGITL